MPAAKLPSTVTIPTPTLDNWRQWLPYALLALLVLVILYQMTTGKRRGSAE
jgi:hypothetical protein